MADANLLVTKKLACKYGEKCYRKNPAHFEEYSHAGIDDHAKNNREIDCPQEESSSSFTRSAKRLKIDRSSNEYDSRSVEPNKFNFYFTKVRGIDQKWNKSSLALDISDILSIDSEKFQRSIQFNYMIDFAWLASKYPKSNRTKPLTIVTGSIGVEHRAECHNFPNISLLSAKLPIAYGTHHTKMMLLFYDHGLRVVVHTANLIEQDWDQKTQGIYLSPLFPKIPDSGGFDQLIDSDTKFGADLIDYLKSYDLKQLTLVCDELKKFNYSLAKVCIVGSTPGRHAELNLHKWGHFKLRNLLKSAFKQAATSEKSKIENWLPDKSWPVIGQFSSIGSLGSSADNWLTGELKMSLSECGKYLATSPPLSLVFPCVDDVRLSLEGYPAGASLPYSTKTAAKQTYLNSYLHKWRADAVGRTHASPHVKTYFRTDQNFTRIAWFLVTSANLSKAAWGVLEKNKTQLMIRSYELGVLFLPSYFGLNYFDLRSEDNAFILPVDLPLTKYDNQDKPWTWDSPHTAKPDTHGNMWQPS